MQEHSGLGRGFLFWLLLLIFIAKPLCTMQAAWDLVKHEDRDYVRLSNVAKFYGFKMERSGIKGFRLSNLGQTMETSENSKEFFINGLKFILSFHTVAQGSDLLISRVDLTRLIEPVLRPSRIRGAKRITTVVLDPGHGGHDGGARGSLGLEKAFALDTALKARTLLQKAGFKVVMTRESDRFVELKDRAHMANRYRDAILISIHYNASSNLQATGVETFTLAPRGVPSTASDGPRVSDMQLCPGNVRDPENMALATAMHSALVARAGMPDRGIKRARFVVLREATIPAVLVEGGFVTNARDARKIASSGYRQQVALAIFRAVQNYQSAIMSRSGGASTLPGSTIPGARESLGSEMFRRNFGPSQPSQGPTVIIPREPNTPAPTPTPAQP